jgi:DNA-binding response OmpR family regulator
MAKVLVVDDEKNIVELAKLYLTKEGYDVISAADGAEALQKVKAQRPALVILDIMLPQVDGWEVCRRLRQAEDDVPIIMLTARGDDVDKIVGLELGADDYVVKPFNPRELVARVKAVLRRYEAGLRPAKTVALRDLHIDHERREMRVKDELITLRAREFDLLAYLVQNRGLVLSRGQILDAVWGYDYYGDTRTVDVHIAHLRDKLAGSGVAIETVWRVGYKLVAESSQ